MKVLPTTLKAAFLLGTFLLAHAAHAASFNCKQAKTKKEIIICTDPELNALDERLGEVYQQALKVHPLPTYIRQRQRLWLKEEVDPNVCNTASKCDTEILKDNYEWRIRTLESAKSHMVYTATGDSKFNYDNGDTVVEVWRDESDTWNIYIFGGAVIHKLASQENNQKVMTNCEFDGQAKSLKSGVAESGDVSIKFKASENTFDIAADSSNKICTGFAGVGRSYMRVRK